MDLAELAAVLVYRGPSSEHEPKAYARNQARLTQAALETMAVVAYRQPISRTRISAIRGVNVDSVVRTLVTRGLVEESDVDPESGAILYRTTSYFLERMGMGRPPPGETLIVTGMWVPS